MPSVIDRILAFLAVMVLSPLFIIAFIGVKISSSGPFLYSATRAGLNGKPFKMYKIRTMHVQKTGEERQKITATQDKRIFLFGRFLRLTKIDELPQLINILNGDMAIVGPRPEDAEIVAAQYHDWHHETLSVRPGLSSPGALFNYTHFHMYVRDEHAEIDYLENFLDRKLALDAVYARHKGCLYDIQIVCRTIVCILKIALGRAVTDNPREAAEAKARYAVDYL